MTYTRSTVVDGERGTAGRVLKVDHAGEFGAVNIYRAQILVAKLSRSHHRTMLEEFIEHERRHLDIFETELKERGVRRCRSFWLCGVGGYALGIVTGLLGRKAVMACTAAVESVVTRHLQSQLDFLVRENDKAAYTAVSSILQDEQAHRDAAVEAGTDCVFYRPLHYLVEVSTEFVIWLGMRL